MAINEMDARLISQGTQVESVGAEALIPVASGEGQPQSNITLANLADSLGKAVPQQQDAEQVTMTGLYAQTSDGKMVELTKESVASVMAGLMGNKFFAFPVLIGNKTINDETLAEGSYSFSSAQAEGLTSYSGVLYVSGKADGTQVRYIVSKDIVAFKRTDGDWMRADNFGYNTKEELASMVAGQMSNEFLNQTSDDIIADGEIKFALISSNANDTFFPNGGMVLNFPCYENYAIQLAFRNDNKGLYIRVKTSSNGISQWKNLFENMYA